MLIDARSLKPDAVIETDVCVVGAGPAGIAVAHELARAGAPVALLESGPLHFDEAAQALNDGEGGPIRRYSLRELRERRRQFGGMANLWSAEIANEDVNEGLARFALPEQVDFEALEWFPRSGWPFGRSELEPFLARAYEHIGLAPDLVSSAPTGDADSSPLAFDGGRIVTTMSPYASGHHLALELRDSLLSAERVQVVINATCLSLVADAGAERITRVRVATLDRNELTVQARIFVLAAGGIENPRLLLTSQETPPGGLGNGHDLVGRCFMEHPFVTFGVLEPADRTVFERLRLYDLHRVGGQPVIGGLAVSEEVRREQHLLGARAYLVPRDRTFGRDGVRSLLTLIPSVRAGEPPLALPLHLLRIARDAPSVARFVARRIRRPEYQHQENRGGWSAYPPDPDRYGVIQLIGLVEQVPDPRNRVTLSAKRDVLGVPRARLEFNWTVLDRDSVSRTCAILAEDVAASGLGRFVAWDPLRPGGLSIHSPHHHMGTTRMNDDPRDGVVDRNCRIHGVANLYIAGSSVFPTGAGAANPTLTIIALAIRLADHLKSASGVPDVPPHA
jgi:choline dehydrogenase-like flavoprotein